MVGGPFPFDRCRRRRSQPHRAARRQETVMSKGSKVLLFALAATFVAADVPTAKAAPRPRLCTAGRFAVSGTPLIGPGGEIVVLENRNISIGSLCQPRHARPAAQATRPAGRAAF